MKLELIGHDEKYAVEQSLLTLFPDERPVYGPVTDEDASAARITLTEDADSVCITTELRCGGKAAARSTYSSPPTVRVGGLCHPTNHSRQLRAADSRPDRAQADFCRNQ